MVHPIPLWSLAGLAVAGALGLCSPAAAQERLAVPIVIGGDTETDPCGYAEVRGLDPQGDGFLAVRDGPGTGYAMLEQLHNGDHVFVCADDGGGWLGIVYPADGPDCEVGTPWPEQAAYSGPCRSGWVSRKWVKMLAG